MLLTNIKRKRKYAEIVRRTFESSLKLKLIIRLKNKQNKNK